MTRKAITRLGLAVFASVFMAGLVLADPATEGVPQLVIGETRYDFGSVVEGSPVACEFVIANKGDAPLQILKLESG